MHIHCLTQKIHILSVSSKILSNVDSFSKSVQYICWRTCIYIYIKGVYLSSFVILLSTHLTRQTDRQTDRQTASFPVFPGPGGKRYDYHHYHSLPPHPPSPSFLVLKMWVKMPRGDSLITSGEGGGGVKARWIVLSVAVEEQLELQCLCLRTLVILGWLSQWLV